MTFNGIHSIVIIVGRSYGLLAVFHTRLLLIQPQAERKNCFGHGWQASRALQIYKMPKGFVAPAVRIVRIRVLTYYKT